MWEKEDFLVFCLVTSQSRFTYFHLGFPNSPRFFVASSTTFAGQHLFCQKSQGAALRKRFPSHCRADFALVVCQHRLLDPEMRVSDVVFQNGETQKGFHRGPRHDFLLRMWISYIGGKQVMVTWLGF